MALALKAATDQDNKRVLPAIGAIEDGVEIPAEQPKSTYPWVDMKVGQSFFVSGTKEQGISRSAKVYARHFPGFAVEIRPEGNGYRVWRTA